MFDELIINMIFVGVFVGVGIGMIIWVGGIIVGFVILVRIVNKYLDWNISYVLFFFDLIVVFSFYFIIGVEKMMFMIVMLYIGMKVMDFIIEGLNMKKVIIVILENKGEIVE